MTDFGVKEYNKVFDYILTNYLRSIVVDKNDNANPTKCRLNGEKYLFNKTVFDKNVVLLLIPDEDNLFLNDFVIYKLTANKNSRIDFTIIKRINDVITSYDYNFINDEASNSVTLKLHYKEIDDNNNLLSNDLLMKNISIENYVIKNKILELGDYGISVRITKTKDELLVSNISHSIIDEYDSFMNNNYNAIDDNRDLIEIVDGIISKEKNNEIKK